MMMKNVNKKGQSSGRIYFFDWLRILAFALVVLIHCVHMFGDLYRGRGDIGVKVTSDLTAYGLTFITQWAMVLFFLLAGASTWLALRRKTPRQFIQERFWRLIVPFAIGYVLIVPLQAYFDMVSNGQYNGNLIEFYPFFLGNILFYGKLHWVIIHIHHLWFLLYLFGFSVITLPLCMYLRSEAGQVWIERLAGICERPGGLLVLVLPLILVQISLRALFPVYCSLTDMLSWMLLYMYGYVLFASPRLRQAIQDQGRMALGLGIAGCGAIVVLWGMGLLRLWVATPDYSAGCLFFQALTMLTLWSWLIAILAAGDTYLNKNHAFLAYGSAASFSWYLLHFPVVVIIAYSILPLQLNVPVAFIVIAGISFLITFMLTDLLLLRQRGALAFFTIMSQPELSEQPVRYVQPERMRTAKLGTQPLPG